MGTLPLSLFQKLPKTDLHVHLDGSLRLQTVIDLAREQGVALPSFDAGELQQAMHIGRNTGNLVKYLEAFDVTLSALQTADALYRATYELAEDAAAENVRYMEVRYSPMLHTRRGLRLTQIVETVLKAAHDAELAFGISTRLILCGIRNISTASSLQMAELVVAYKNRGVVGFDLAGAEYDYPAKDHAEAFALVRKNNINVTIHAGEAYGPASIAQAIHDCGAHRIGHGCRLREDGDLLHYVVDHRIPLECCPSSNVQTGAVKSLATHPLKLYFNLGARVTVNTDNRLITDTTMSKELHLLHTEMGYGMADIKQVIMNGFKSAFMPFHEKRRYLEAIAAELAAFPDEEGGVSEQREMEAPEPPEAGGSEQAPRVRPSVVA